MDRYLDAALSPEERARDLLARMDLNEKFAQLQCWSMMDGFMGKPVEKSFPHGVGQVSCLAVTMMQDRQEVAALARKTQEAVLAASPHHIPVQYQNCRAEHAPKRDEVSSCLFHENSHRPCFFFDASLYAKGQLVLTAKKRCPLIK